MYAINTYEQIEKQEKELNENHIIVLLFVRPSVAGSDEIINEFNYLHYNSKRYCSVYAVGYTNDPNQFAHYIKVNGVNGSEWYYSDEKFVDFKEKLEKRIQWKYSGENELIVLQSNINGRAILNFQNYIAININEGIRENYISSYPLFMEKLIAHSKSEIEASNAINKTTRFGIRKVAEMSIDEVKKIPTPISRLLKNKLFFKTSRTKK